MIHPDMLSVKSEDLQLWKNGHYGPRILVVFLFVCYYNGGILYWNCIYTFTKKSLIIPREWFHFISYFICIYGSETIINVLFCSLFFCMCFKILQTLEQRRADAFVSSIRLLITWSQCPSLITSSQTLDHPGADILGPFASCTRPRTTASTPFSLWKLCSGMRSQKMGQQMKWE